MLTKCFNITHRIVTWTWFDGIRYMLIVRWSCKDIQRHYMMNKQKHFNLHKKFKFDYSTQRMSIAFNYDNCIALIRPKQRKCAVNFRFRIKKSNQAYWFLCVAGRYVILITHCRPLLAHYYRRKQFNESIFCRINTKGRILFNIFWYIIKKINEILWKMYAERTLTR